MSQAVSEPARSATVFRVEVRPAPGQPDPTAAAALEEARAAFGLAVGLRSARVYLVEAPLDEAQQRRVATELLADPVSQTALLGAGEHAAVIEVHYLPGVMDPVADSTRQAIAEMFPDLDAETIQVRTGVRYDLLNTDAPPEAIQKFAARALANPVIQEIHLKPFTPARFPDAQPYDLKLRHVPTRDLDDQGLARLSRRAHLFLSLDEMKAIRDYFRSVGRDPTDVEVETIAQTWSEHCVHKTLKATIRYREKPRPGVALPAHHPTARDFAQRHGHTLNPDGTVTITNLLKSTIAAATHELMSEDHFRDWCISVFKDNAGVVRFDDADAVCIKVETHNHPSAIEPYGGAATGIGGCIRDVMGTGLSARPIANTDVFCVAAPEVKNLPKGVIAPRRILQQVVAGVRDYGNRMGIPTVAGGVYFHESYLGNPLVFAGCVGLLPVDKCFGEALPGDRIIVLGGRTGRDGIHGATFSSAELTDTHADEFAHAVQIGNAITQKTMMDVILQARDHEPSGGGCLFHAITDCGAGGFSSAVGEMGAKIGAVVELDRAPLKYQGLSYTEIWISEAQERMVLAVPPEKVPALRSLCAAEGVEMCDLGAFGYLDESEPTLVLNFRGQQVGRLSLNFLHDGLPTPVRDADWPPPPPPEVALKITREASGLAREPSIGALLTSLLAHPNIASKHWIIRQYDHEVQGGSVVKPLVGPRQDGPSDAAVLRPKLTSDRGIALACGLQTGLAAPGGASDPDPYWMALAAIDEAVRNLVCVGADATHIALLDNFCWPRCDDPKNLGSLVRAAEGCRDGALAYRAPFVSGKDSLNNQFTTEDGQVIAIAPTLLITALGLVPDVKRAATMDAKNPGNLLLIVGFTTDALGGSHFAGVRGQGSGVRGQGSGVNLKIPRVDLKRGPTTAGLMAKLIACGAIASAHDCSDGGLLVAAAEMAFAGRVGLDLDLQALPTPDGQELDPSAACFAETPSRYLLEVAPGSLDRVVRELRQSGLPFGQVGTFARHDRLTLRTPRHGRLLDEPLEKLRQTWLKPLDW